MIKANKYPPRPTAEPLWGSHPDYVTKRSVTRTHSVGLTAQLRSGDLLARNIVQNR